MKRSLNLHPALIAALCLVTVPLAAQSTAPVDAATLAKYDKNHNGTLDPDERAAMEADNTVQLSPFEVRTDKDVGYQAIDAGTGGRIDLPFKMSASAMSAMTKEFMEDWSITDMRDAFRYSMSVDAGNFTQNGFPYGDFEFNFRGAGSSGNYPTRNTFLNYSVGDSYNTERFEFSRGPNSILFGDGQIGGLATSSTKTARFNRDAYAGTARWDSWGGWRFTADLNKIVTPKFAARLNLLYQKNTYGQAWRDGALSNDRGLDFTATYVFRPGTQISVDAEFDNKRNVSFATTYTDNVGYYTQGTVYDGVTAFTSAQQSALGVTPVSTQAQNWTVIPALAQFGLINTGASKAYRSTGPGFGFSIQPEGRSDLPGIATVAKLPSREFNLGPNNSWSRFKQQTFTVNLDHRFNDKISGRLSFYDYNNDRHSRGGIASLLQYDISKVLPNGQANPKLGVLYGEESPGRSYQENYVYEWRGLVTYRTPLPFWRAKGQFAGVLGVRNERFEATGYSAARVDGPNPNYFAAENTIRYRFYVDEPLKYGGIDLPAPAPGFTYAWIQSGFASVEHKDIQYAQLVSALSLWDDRVSITLGGRNDDLVDDQYGNISGFNDPVHNTQAYGGFVPGLGNRPGAHNLTKAGAFTSNAGVVAWIDQGQHVGAFYNYSQNFAPPTSGAAKIVGFNSDGTINGAAFGATRGKGSEFGLRFNFLQGRVSGEARYYKNDQIDRIDNPPVGNFTSIWGSAGPTYANNVAYTQMSFRDVASIQTYGYEFQAVANVGGIRLSANYALPRTKSVDVRPVTRAYFEAFQATWAKWAADLKNDKGEALTAAEATNINNQILSIQNNIAGSAPGTVQNGTNKWTGSLAATYQFSRESALRGLSIGYGINGRGQRKVGSVNSSILFKLPNGVAATPAQNRAAAFAYLYQPSYFTHDLNIAYRKRIGKYNYRFQVNVNNLTDKNDLIFSGYTTYRVLGQSANPLLGMFPGGFNYLDPRKVMLTTAVDF